MKKTLTILLILSFAFYFSQEEPKKEAVATVVEKIKKELADKTCLCIDSVKSDIINKKRKENIEGVNECIKNNVGAYMIGKKMAAIDPNKSSKIDVNFNENSKDYVDAKKELEDYLMNNCPSLRFILKANDTETDKSVSPNPKAREYYTQGINESNNNNWEKAVEYYKMALKEDENFPFAWDNLGLSYRQLGKYNEAIEAYKKSISLDPNHAFPLQNLAVAYTYIKEYQKAIDTFEELKKIDENNPEIYYGIGQIYYQHLKDYEKSLDYMCKAFNLYNKLKSPYRSDAENIIKYNYSELKKLGKEDKFYEILKANNINVNK